jgi:hypothetical protein
MSIVKPNLGRHSGQANNRLTFHQAYEQAQASPGHIYHTTGNQTAFTVEATHGQRGEHAHSAVLRFISDGTERARAYECCWGHRTNCNCTHIDIYTEAVGLSAAQPGSQPDPRNSAFSFGLASVARAGYLMR